MEPQDTQTNQVNKKGSKGKLILLVITLVVLFSAASSFATYKIRENKNEEPVAQTNEDSSSQASSETKQNTAPEGYVFYENKELGFKFAYPKEWGDITLSTDGGRMAGTGEYMIGEFSGATNIIFGGRGTDYKVTDGRGGARIDLGRFSKVAGRYYETNFSKDVTDPNGQQSGITRQITDTAVEVGTFEGSALLVSYPYSEFFDGQDEVVVFNLKDDENIYVLNLVASNPDVNTKDSLKIIASTFELI